jgi:hypothetical protein
MKRVFCSLIVLGLFLGVAGQAKAEYTFTTLDVPGSNCKASVNPSGSLAFQPVGDYNGRHACWAFADFLA